MAQIAIPLVIAGVLYLISNDKKEGFSIDACGNYTYTDDENKEFNNNYKKMDNVAYNKSKVLEDITVTTNIAKTGINVNDKGIYSQYQDKYMSPQSNTNNFVSLSGEKVDNMKHNNMNVFFNNKSNDVIVGLPYNILCLRLYSVVTHSKFPTELSFLSAII